MILYTALLVRTLADPDLQKRGGQIFDEIFQRPFLGISQKNFFIPQKFHMYLPKFLTTFFFHRGGQICSRHRYGGWPKSLLFNKITILPLLFLSQRGGQTPLPISMGGPWPDLPPLDPPLPYAAQHRNTSHIIILSSFLSMQSCKLRPIVVLSLQSLIAPFTL